MPFGVCSAPEVWQRTMHEFVEDLEGVKVIADDFLIAGFGIGDREVNNNLKKTWAHFSQEMPLVEPEIESCQSETAPVKHEIHGSATHLSGPEKIQAILQMPEPKDVTALKRFLGMVTYLAKFMPHLSEMTEPLRRLEDKNVEFQWLPQYSLAMNTIEKFLTETPTCSSLLWCKQANHCPMWYKPGWLRGCIAARWPACLLCLLSPWSLGRVTKWTNTSWGET